MMILLANIVSHREILILLIEIKEISESMNSHQKIRQERSNLFRTLTTEYDQ